MNKKERQNIISSSTNELISYLEESNMICDDNKRYIATSINGMKAEYHIEAGCLRVGFGLEQENLDAIYEYLLESYDEPEIIRRNKYVDVLRCELEDFKEFLNILEDLELPEEFKHYKATKQIQTGVSFEGSNFSNAHERATTIGNRFMKMVCKASGMSDNYDSEWISADGGRIDAVEIDEETNAPISIYECQSGIQNGAYLDNDHLNKVLLRYPSDPGISPTLKKIVILAGGYNKEHLQTIKWQAENLAARNIEVILLKTIRIEDKISVELISY